MTLDEVEKAVKEVMGKDPIEMCVRYYEGLIQLSADRIADEKATINKLKKRILELNNSKEASTKGGENNV